MIIIAQAGATLIMRGVTPANIPLMPFVRKIFLRASMVLVSVSLTGLSGIIKLVNQYFWKFWKSIHVIQSI